MMHHSTKHEVIPRHTINGRGRASLYNYCMNQRSAHVNDLAGYIVHLPYTSGFRRWETKSCLSQSIDVGFLVPSYRCAFRHIASFLKFGLTQWSRREST